MNLKYLFLIVTIALYSMVLWAFALRQVIPFDSHYLYPLIFLFLFVVQVSVAYRVMDQFRFLKTFQPLSILLFISLNIYLLSSVSSVKRENEIRNYFSKNELPLANIVDHFDSYGDDNQTQQMKCDMNLERIYHGTKLDTEIGNMVNMRMYTCAGYGYGVIYTCDAEINQPEKLGGCPVTNWMKLKDHWFYYSIFD